MDRKDDSLLAKAFSSFDASRYATNKAGKIYENEVRLYGNTPYFPLDEVFPLFACEREDTFVAMKRKWTNFLKTHLPNDVSTIDSFPKESMYALANCFLSEGAARWYYEERHGILPTRHLFSDLIVYADYIIPRIVEKQRLCRKESPSQIIDLGIRWRYQYDMYYSFEEMETVYGNGRSVWAAFHGYDMWLAHHRNIGGNCMIPVATDIETKDIQNKDRAGEKNIAQKPTGCKVIMFEEYKKRMKS